MFIFDGFGPPRIFTPASAWPWVDHLLSGLLHATRRAVSTRFRFGFVPEGLNLAAYSNSPDHSAKGTRSGVQEQAPA